jgi:hypothetical protein
VGLVARCFGWFNSNSVVSVGLLVKEGGILSAKPKPRHSKGAGAFCEQPDDAD